jgi:acetyl-CoA acetyltransferase
MKRIDRTSEYDIPEWADWLDYHGFDIEEVESVEIGTTVAAVYLYVLDEDGNRQRGSDQFDRSTVKMHRVTFDIRRPEPAAVVRA